MVWLNRTSHIGKHRKVWGNQAAHGSASTDLAPAFSRIPLLELPRSVPSRVRVRTCSRKGAPQFLCSLRGFKMVSSPWSGPSNSAPRTFSSNLRPSASLPVIRPRPAAPSPVPAAATAFTLPAFSRVCHTRRLWRSSNGCWITHIGLRGDVAPQQEPWRFQRGHPAPPRCTL